MYSARYVEPLTPPFRGTFKFHVQTSSIGIELMVITRRNSEPLTAQEILQAYRRVCPTATFLEVQRALDALVLLGLISGPADQASLLQIPKAPFRPRRPRKSSVQTERGSEGPAHA